MHNLTGESIKPFHRPNVPFSVLSSRNRHKLQPVQLPVGVCGTGWGFRWLRQKKAEIILFWLWEGLILSLVILCIRVSTVQTLKVKNVLIRGENYGLEINFDLNNLDANTVVLIRTSVCKLINVCFVFYLIIFEWMNVKAIHFSFMSNCSLDFIFFSVK